MTRRGPGGEPRRSATRVDSYAPWQIRRQFRLRGIELAVLLALVLQADWRDPYWSWEGTITDLHEDTGFTRRAIRSTEKDQTPGALEVLAAKGLVVIERDFGGGRFGSGLLRIPIYEQMVKVHQGQHHSRESARVPEPVFAPDARPTRALHASSSREKARVQARNSDERGIGASRETGALGEPPAGLWLDEHEPIELSDDELDALTVRAPEPESPDDDVLARWEAEDVIP